MLFTLTYQLWLQKLPSSTPCLNNKTLLCKQINTVIWGLKSLQ